MKPETVYCPKHLRLEPATIDRENGVRIPHQADAIQARATLLCGKSTTVATTEHRR